MVCHFFLIFTKMIDFYIESSLSKFRKSFSRGTFFEGGGGGLGLIFF